MRNILFLFFIVNISFAQQEKILVTDLTKIKNASTIIFSPDGSKAIYLVKSITANVEKPFEFEYINQLFLVKLSDPKNHIALTNSKESVSQPAFSADGNQVAFVRTVKEKPQVFLLSLQGGEASQLTNIKYGATNPKFNPNGKSLIFSSSISIIELLKDSVLNTSKKYPKWSFEKPGFKNNESINTTAKADPNGTIAEVRAYLLKDEVDKKAKVINRLNFQGEATVEPEIKINALFTIDLKENSKEKRIIDEFVSINNATFIENGNKIIYTIQKDLDQHPDREQESKVCSYSFPTGESKDLIVKVGKNFSNLSITANGNKIAAVMNSPNLLSFGTLIIANSDGSEFSEITFDRVPGNLCWTTDQKMLYFTAGSNGGFPIYKLDASTKKIDQLTNYQSGITDFDINKEGKIIYAKTEVSNPCELFITDTKFTNHLLISELNSDWLKNKLLSFPEKRIFTNSLGQKVDFWIMKPSNFNSNKKYPLLLQLHGGPTAMWGPGEGSMWHEFQYFCAQGYGIVYPNQRGSGGYGKEFQFSNYRDWGTGPQEDALGASSIAERETWVDTSKLVITGGSYAGYLTAWIIAFDHRFKAAFAQRGVYDLATFMGEGNAWRLTPNYFGLPWEDETITKIKANSPITFVDKIKTPLLIKHGENDLRTGVIQSEMMFKSLKYLEKEVEYVRMPGAGHELSRSGNVRQRIDRILRIYEFFERYISE